MRHFGKPIKNSPQRIGFTLGLVIAVISLIVLGFCCMACILIAIFAIPVNSQGQTLSQISEIAKEKKATVLRTQAKQLCEDKFNLTSTDLQLFTSDFVEKYSKAEIEKMMQQSFPVGFHCANLDGAQYYPSSFSSSANGTRTSAFLMFYNNTNSLDRKGYFEYDDTTENYQIYRIHTGNMDEIYTARDKTLF